MLYIMALAISMATTFMLLLSVTHWLKRDVIRALAIGTLGIFFMLTSTFVATVVGIDKVVKEYGIQQVFQEAYPENYPDDQDCDATGCG